MTVSSDVLFAFGSDALDERARSAVTAVAADLPSGAAVQVVGHTDGVGDGPANQALSERRARVWKSSTARSPATGAMGWSSITSTLRRWASRTASSTAIP